VSGDGEIEEDEGDGEDEADESFGEDVQGHDCGEGEGREEGGGVQVALRKVCEGWDIWALVGGGGEGPHVSRDETAANMGHPGFCLRLQAVEGYEEEMDGQGHQKGLEDIWDVEWSVDTGA